MWVAKPLLCCRAGREIPWICLSSQTRTRRRLKQSQTAAGTAGSGSRRESSIIQQKSQSQQQTWAPAKARDVVPASNNASA